VSGFAVEVVDPLGAGDAFVAAMLSQLLVAGASRPAARRAAQLMEEPRPLRLSDGRLREIMTFANAAGALACTRRGVIPALPTREEIAAFLAARSA
jgi:sugar/nucleoside kinase (ribokinase family)